MASRWAERGNRQGLGPSGEGPWSCNLNPMGVWSLLGVQEEAQGTGRNERAKWTAPDAKEAGEGPEGGSSKGELGFLWSFTNFKK